MKRTFIPPTYRPYVKGTTLASELDDVYLNRNNNKINIYNTRERRFLIKKILTNNNEIEVQKDIEDLIKSIFISQP